MSLGLALVGHGKMGKLLEHLASSRDFVIRAVFDSANNSNASGLTGAALRGVDVAIEFTNPAAAPANLRRLAELGIRTVCGTTGWYEHLPSLREAVAQNHTALVYASNFSIGMNLFMQIVANAASLFAKQSQYEAWGWEIHHSAKKDAPSGTLRSLEEQMRANGYDRPVGLIANRAGAHPGTHEIGFDSVGDTITLRHTARNRDDFAVGALRAAHWVNDKKGVFQFREILQELT